MSETIERATSPKALQAFREMCWEYADTLSIDLRTQSLSQELAELPGKYAPPGGCILIAMVSGKPTGCVAIRQLSDGICEMKRLYVRPDYRGTGLGRRLVERVIHEARALGHTIVRLDTLPRENHRAFALYQSLGFVEIPPYWNNELAGVVYMELQLRQQPGNNV